jgi:hypothetical protein
MRIGKSNALLPLHRREGTLLGCVCPEEPPSLAGAPAACQPCGPPPGRRTADGADGQQKAGQPCDVEAYWGRSEYAAMGLEQMGSAWMCCTFGGVRTAAAANPTP